VRAPAIETRRLRKHYRRGPTVAKAVDGIDLRIERGDASRLGGDARAVLRARRIGFVLQEFDLLPGLTAIENFLLPLRYAGGNGDGRRRGERLLEEVGLGPRAHHKPSELSGGEQQRVAIARSLVNDPAIVLADEPTGEMDTGAAEELVGLMRRVNRERGATFVVVTHDQDLASRADRVVRLQDGRVARA